jgi:hypothetical protein
MYIMVIDEDFFHIQTYIDSTLPIAMALVQLKLLYAQENKRI